MRRTRRVEFDEVRFEMAPLLDVVFLLLTFFMFAMLVLVRTDAIDLDLPALDAGAQAEPVEAIRVTLEADGTVMVDGNASQDGDWAGLFDAVRLEKPEAPVHLFVDQRGERRDLLDLTAMGVRDVRLMGAVDRGEDLGG